jgi:hypothetical protein
MNIMRKILYHILIVMLFLIPWNAISQTYFFVDGLVLGQNGNGVPNHEIYMSIYDMEDELIFDTVFFTDAFGYFEYDGFIDDAEPKLLILETENCYGDELVEEFEFEVAQNHFFHTFIYCEEDCQAIFDIDYESSEDLTVQFIDLSIGDVEYWNWDFGDGQTSTEAEPVHTFPASGIYTTCLEIYTEDSLCYGQLCIEHPVGFSNECEASFEWAYDSLIGGAEYVIFTNTSETTGNALWFWDFGDGNFSLEHSPQHLYNEPGEYEVCLRMVTSLNCESVFCDEIEIGEVYDLGGHVFTGDTPINNPEESGDTAIVELYRVFDDEQLKLIKSQMVTDFGYYSFVGLREGDYQVRVELTRNSAHYSDYLPAYYPSSVFWNFEEIISLEDDEYEMAVYLPVTEDIYGGKGDVNGFVEVCNKNEVDDLSSLTGIILGAEQEVLSGFEIDENGNFIIENLNDGLYELRIDYPGIYSSREMIYVSGTNFTKEVEMMICEDDWVGQQEFSFESELIIWPNPVSNHFYLSCNSENIEWVDIQVFSLSGVLLLKESYTLRDDYFKTLIDVSSLSSGVYMIMITDSMGHVFNEKIIKK